MAQISIIIPSFNRLHLLGRALASVVQQTWTNWDLWLVDDGSTDGTHDFFLEWVEEAGEKHRMHYIYQNHSGVSRARNMGVHMSKAPLLAFLDSDDEWLPHKLELQMAMYETTLQRLIHGEELWIRNGKQVKVPTKYKKHGGRIFIDCLPVCAISPSTVVMERSLFEEVGGFREDFAACEDYDLWLKICARYEVGLVEHPVLFKYGGHEDQLSMTTPALDRYRVKALEDILKSSFLLPEERIAAMAMLAEKTEILRKGAAKRTQERQI
jgi:glycosyltransferase involved in cell wall biosynthesis